MAYTPAEGTAFETDVDVPATATAIQAIRASGILERHPAIDVSVAAIGVWGRVCAHDAALQAGDRVEVYRPLAMDPNEARRLRAKELRERRKRA